MGGMRRGSLRGMLRSAGRGSRGAGRSTASGRIRFSFLRPLEGSWTYSSKRLQREIIRHINRIHHQRSIRLEREPLYEPHGCRIRERDMREEEERGPEDYGDADEVDGDVYGVGVVACVEC
jgi:hypothetical protein